MRDKEDSLLKCGSATMLYLVKDTSFPSENEARQMCSKVPGGGRCSVRG
jgi:hypothetical protein